MTGGSGNESQRRLCRRRGRILEETPATGDLGFEELIDRIAEELHERVAHQRSLSKRLLGAKGNSRSRLAYRRLVDCPRLAELRAVLRKTITVLEQTKSSFKSKRLEVMRRKRTDILAGCWPADRLEEPVRGRLPCARPIASFRVSFIRKECAA